MTARDVAAYLLDRADQYELDSPCWIGLADAARNIMRGEVEAAKRNGEFDQALYARVDALPVHVLTAEERTLLEEMERARNLGAQP